MWCDVGVCEMWSDMVIEMQNVRCGIWRGVESLYAECCIMQNVESYAM